jgi:hypothetical protein
VNQQVARLDHEVQRGERANNPARARRGDIGHQSADAEFDNRIIAADW